MARSAVSQFRTHGNNLYQFNGGSGRGDNTFLLTLTCRVFLLFRGRGGRRCIFFPHPTCFPNRYPAKDLLLDFLGLFRRGGGLGGIYFIPQLLAGLAKNIILSCREGREGGDSPLYVPLIPKLPKCPVSLRSHLCHTPSTIRGEPSYHDRV